MKNLFIVVLICLSLPSVAATRFLDNSVASSGNGLSWATAWKNFSNITGVGAGDTVMISGGSSGLIYNTAELAPAPSGSSGNPFTYQAACDAGHSGVITIRGPGNGHFLFSNSSTGAGQWYTINGNCGGNINIIFTNWDNDIQGDAGTGLVFRYVEFDHQLHMNGVQQLELDHVFLNLNSGGDRAVQGSLACSASPGYTNNKIHDSIIWLRWGGTSGFGDDGIGGPQCLTFANNQIIGIHDVAYPGTQHQDGLQGQGQFVDIHGNFFQNMQNYPIYGDILGAGTLQHWRIYNNIMYDPVTSAGNQGTAIGCDGVGGCAMTDIVIANNTYVSNVQCIQINNNSTPGTVTNSFVYNNICYNSGPNSFDTATNSNNTTATTNINFVNPTSDWHLTSPSTAVIDQGTSNATVTAVLTTDKDGIARPQFAAWDIGAYEYNGTLPTTINSWYLLNECSDIHSSDLGTYSPSQVNFALHNATITMTRSVGAFPCKGYNGANFSSTQNYNTGAIMWHDLNFGPSATGNPVINCNGTCTIRARIRMAGGWSVFWLLGGNKSIPSGCQPTSFQSWDNFQTCFWDQDTNPNGDSAEADIMENIGTPPFTTTTHTVFFNGLAPLSITSPVFSDANANFHTFELQWSTTQLCFFVDDISSGCETSRVPQNPMFPIIENRINTQNTYNGAFPVTMTVQFAQLCGGTPGCTNSDALGANTLFLDDFGSGAQVATPTFSPVAGTYGSAQTVTISSTTASAVICYTLDGTAPTADGAGTCTHGTTLANGGTVLVSTSSTVQALGSLSGNADSVVGSATYTIGVPSASLAPASLSFGGINISNTSASQTLTLQNTGTAAMTVTSVSLTGANTADFFQSNNCPVGSTLGNGASCVITVTFTPLAVGARSASISVVDGALGSPHTSGLSGTGVQASISGRMNPGARMSGRAVVK